MKKKQIQPQAMYFSRSYGQKGSNQLRDPPGERVNFQIIIKVPIIKETVFELNLPFTDVHGSTNSENNPENPNPNSVISVVSPEEEEDQIAEQAPKTQPKSKIKRPTPGARLTKIVKPKKYTGKLANIYRSKNAKSTQKSKPKGPKKPRKAFSVLKARKKKLTKKAAVQKLRRLQRGRRRPRRPRSSSNYVPGTSSEETAWIDLNQSIEVDNESAQRRTVRRNIKKWKKRGGYRYDEVVQPVGHLGVDGIDQMVSSYSMAFGVEKDVIAGKLMSLGGDCSRLRKTLIFEGYSKFFENEGEEG